MFPSVKLVLPDSVHLVSQIPNIFSWYMYISRHTCAVFPISSVLMFQVPILFLVLGVRRIFGTPASLGLSPVKFVFSATEDSSSTKLIFKNSCLCGFCNVVFFFSGTGLIGPTPTPNQCPTPTRRDSE